MLLPRAEFGCQRHETLITQALENNRDPRIAAGLVLEARALFGISRADGLPQLNLPGSGSPSRNAAALDVSIPSVSFEPDFWGRIKSLFDTARFCSNHLTGLGYRHIRLERVMRYARSTLPANASQKARQVPS